MDVFKQYKYCELLDMIRTVMGHVDTCINGDAASSLSYDELCSLFVKLTYVENDIMRELGTDL